MATDHVDGEELDLGTWADEQPIDLPEFKDPFPMESGYVPTPVISGEGTIADYDDFRKINQQIDALRVGLYEMSKHIREAELRWRRAKIDYDRHFSRAYLAIEAKTEAMRKAIASIQCEVYENRMISREFIYNDLKRRAVQMVNELDALKTLAYNFRKEADLSR